MRWSFEFGVADDDGDCDRGRETGSEDFEGFDGTPQPGALLRLLRGQSERLHCNGVSADHSASSVVLFKVSILLFMNRCFSMLWILYDRRVMDWMARASVSILLLSALL